MYQRGKDCWILVMEWAKAPRARRRDVDQWLLPPQRGLSPTNSSGLGLWDNPACANAALVHGGPGKHSKCEYHIFPMQSVEYLRSTAHVGRRRDGLRDLHVHILLHDARGGPIANVECTCDKSLRFLTQHS